MFIKDLRAEFFSVLRHQRVLILANIDVDSVCAVKILLSLFQCDQISYTLVPVSGRSEMIKAFRENMEESKGSLKYVVLINCGGNMDVAGDFGLIDEEDPLASVLSQTVIFITDSHRPIDVTNVYNDGQIRLLMNQDPNEGIPDYNDIFRDSDVEEDPSDDDEDERGEKKSRFDEGVILKNRERRIWEEKRDKILFDYSQFSYYGHSTAVQMYELAWKMSRDTNELLWCAIVGLTEQLVMQKTDDEQYVLETNQLRDHVSRLNSKVNTDGMAVNCLRLSFEKELNLVLLRHWTLYESIVHTIYTASKFKIWSSKGKNRLLEFLAELGIPLSQCKQKFTTMDLSLRNDLESMFKTKSDKYKLENIFRGTFSVSFGYRNKFVSTDFVYALISLMEPISSGKANISNAFLEALDSLSKNKISILERGIAKAKVDLTIVMEQVQTFLDHYSVESSVSFLYVIIKEGSPNSKYFSRPNWLIILAHCTIRAFASTFGSKVQTLPLVASAPLDENEGTCLVVGVPPVMDRTRKNLFGLAFEKVVKKTNCKCRLNYSDSSVFQLRTEDRIKFFDGLTTLLS